MAGMATTYELVGDRELLRALKALGEKGEKRIMRKAIRAGLEPIKQIAKAGAPGKELSRLVTKRVNTTRNGVIGAVTLRRSKRQVMFEGRMVGFEVIGNVLEFGSRTRNIRATRFMRNARDQARSSALAIVSEEADRLLEEEWKRH